MKVESIVTFLSCTAGFILFLGNPKAQENFKNGLFVLDKAFNLKPVKIVITILLITVTFGMIALAFMTGLIKITEGQPILGITLSMVMTGCAIGYASCNYTLFYKFHDR